MQITRELTMSALVKEKQFGCTDRVGSTELEVSLCNPYILLYSAPH